MPKPLLLDSDLLIDYSRRLPHAVRYMRSLPCRPMISAVTVTELYTGVREGRERQDLDRFVSESMVVVIDAPIAERAGLIARQYRSSHGTGFADAIIAATAEIERATLVTLNHKHFPMISDLVVPYIKP